MNKLILTASSTKEDYNKVFALSVGDVFKVTDYETVMLRLEHYTPKNLKFEVTPITPGTSLYTIYGCDHVIVTMKELTM